jgi:hypothetical protein
MTSHATIPPHAALILPASDLGEAERRLRALEDAYFASGDPRLHDWKLENFEHWLRGAWRIAVSEALGLSAILGTLHIQKIAASGDVLDYGLVSHRVVTTAGVTKIIDFLRANDTATGQNLKYHGIGTGSTAESAADTALVTELTTEYQTDNTRPTGSQTNNGATVYRTVATITVDSGTPLSIREHGVFSQAATGGGTLLDRSVFAIVTLSNPGDAIAATYDHSQVAGS